MDELYVEIEICSKNDETEIFTTVSSFIALYVYRFLKRNAAALNLKLCFVSSKIYNQGKIKLKTASLCSELEERIIQKIATGATEAIRDLRLPVYIKDGNTYIAGMCAVCRELLSRQGNEMRALLGFKESCLLAPSECSIWTRYCEVDIVRAVGELFYAAEVDKLIEELPLEISRFERHMNEPVRMHNIYKHAREQANTSEQANGDSVKPKSKNKSKVRIECTTPKEQLEIEHKFAEGVAFTIADLILYPCIRLVFTHCQQLLQCFPLTHTWLNEVDAHEPSCAAVLKELYTEKLIEKRAASMPQILDCEATSLYKSDPKRYKPRNRIYTEQSEVDAILSKLQALEMPFTSECSTRYDQNTVDWNAIEPEHEKSSALPPVRLQRKRQQLENLANSVISLSAPGDRIVDFCSGTGHLGILLALQLPQCTVILMENKAISLERAKKRAIELKLNNCRFYQCNIDYFEGCFDVGTSLHACGSATDIVLRHCLNAKAKFVCCPCCYGSLQPMPHIQYPLSKQFRAILNEKQYLYVAHTADQAHEMGTLNCRPETTRQGQLCMDIVDTDRKLQAEEVGYHVILTRLKPEQCTPKNRLLVGTIANN